MKILYNETFLIANVLPDCTGICFKYTYTCSDRTYTYFNCTYTCSNHNHTYPNHTHTCFNRIYTCFNRNYPFPSGTYPFSQKSPPLFSISFIFNPFSPFVFPLPITFQRHIKNAPDNLRSFFINDPALGIVRVLDISIGRLSHWFTGVALDFVTDTAFLADVTGVPLIEQRLFGKGKDKQAEIQYSCGFVAGWLPKS